MTGIAPRTDASPPSRLALRLAWAGLWLLLAIASVEFLLAAYGKYRHLDSAAYGMFMTRRGWLWLHLAGGLTTVLLGPVQFLTQWRLRQPRLHRLTGRIYLVGMLVAATGAIGLIATSPAPFAIRAAFAATALAWLTTALTGLAAILRGAVERHRRWMVRNYAVTLAPIIFRLSLPLAIAGGLAPSPALIATLLWCSWIVPLLVCEAVRRLAGLRRSARARASAGAVPLPDAR
ncbi:DUF2306 domain-containing protein [Pseudoxanthomonas japonensis]|uniref:DUF2306 domain-containing protein n=1 Tax=Pseudoxanthomonas japonensis TaxID=69284 RepID=A0ABQ6ZG11_9GAMM|nr:DUF2306 domain-containing protein [Pseudoxanthomonas japonensis]KAF1724547.1 hypothetical protein CSC78_11810 [Pseudoxanthomonas japonensis]